MYMIKFSFLLYQVLQHNKPGILSHVICEPVIILCNTELSLYYSQKNAQFVLFRTYHMSSYYS